MRGFIIILQRPTTPVYCDISGEKLSSNSVRSVNVIRLFFAHEHIKHVPYCWLQSGHCHLHLISISLFVITAICSTESLSYP
jgi:hypothetical protein